MILKSLIIDDEEIAAKGVERYCRDISFIQLEKICTSAFEAKSFLEKNLIDLIFLDIQMPKQTGLEFLRSLTSPPLVIITTAYNSFALDGFELDVIDYILKPFSFERFLKACTKAKEYVELKTKMPNAGNDDYFFIKADNRLEKIEVNKILFVEALENYVCIYTDKRKYMTLVSLKSMQNHLSEQHFIKVQKSFLVAKDKIDAIDGNMICIANHTIPISRKWKKDILDGIMTNKFLSR